MSSDALWLAVRATTHVLRMGDRFEMLRVYTTTDPAQVVQLQSRRHRTVADLEHEFMDQPPLAQVGASTVALD
jgi:hypothetical protein